jgi:hypothetical protein
MAPISKFSLPGGNAIDSFGIGADGSVCANTAAGLLRIELSASPGAPPEVVTSLLQGLTGHVQVVARYPLRHLVALVLARVRSRRRGSGLKAFLPAAPLPRALRHAHLAALAKFVSINFEKLLWTAHAWGRARVPLRESVRRAIQLAMRGSRLGLRPARGA